MVYVRVLALLESCSHRLCTVHRWQHLCTGSNMLVQIQPLLGAPDPSLVVLSSLATMAVTTDTPVLRQKDWAGNYVRANPAAVAVDVHPCRATNRQEKLRLIRVRYGR